MKKKLFQKKLNLAILLAFALFLSFSSCQKEDEFIEITSDTSNIDKPYSIERFSFKQLQNDQQFQQITSEFKLQEAFSSINNSSVRKKSNNTKFAIDFSSAKKLSDSSGVSYTFLIERNNQESNTFENLIIEKNNEGILNGYFVKYQSEQFWNETNNEPFKGNVSISPYADNLQELIEKVNNQKNSFSKTANRATCGRVRFFSIFVEYSCTSSAHHGVGDGCECSGGVCEAPHVEHYSFSSFVPCNDFSNTTNLGNNGGGSNSTGGGNFGGFGGSNNGSGSAIIGPNGINVPNRDILVAGINYAPYKKSYEDYFNKSWQLFNFLEDTRYTQYNKPENKPIFKGLKDLNNEILKYKNSISKEDFKILYERQKFIIEVLDAVNFDFYALPLEQQKEVAKNATFISIFPYVNQIIGQYWPKNEQEWTVIGDLFVQFLPELALGFIPGSSIVDVVKGIDQGDTFAVAFGIAGVIVDAFGGTIFKGLAKASKVSYKVFKSFKILYKYVKAIGKALKTGFKTKLIGNVVHLTDNINTTVAKITNNSIEVITEKGLKLVNPNGLKTLNKIDPSSSGFINSTKLVDAKKFKPSGSGLKADFDNLKNLDNNQLGIQSETLANKLFKQDDFVAYDAKIPGFNGNNGFDGVYIKKDAGGNVTDIIINEVKQVNNGAISLSPASTTGLPRQMSDNWITNVTQRMINLNTSQNVKDLANLINDNLDKITKVVTGIDKTEGKILVFPIN